MSQVTINAGHGVIAETNSRADIVLDVRHAVAVARFLQGIGVALTAGVALRLAALSGAVMMVLMWAAEWPLARHDSTGELTSSVNPFVDDHLIYAIAMVVIALTAGAGFTWGLSDRRRQIPIVAANPILW